MWRQTAESEDRNVSIMKASFLWNTITNEPVKQRYLVKSQWCTAVDILKHINCEGKTLEGLCQP